MKWIAIIAGGLVAVIAGIAMVGALLPRNHKATRTLRIEDERRKRIPTAQLNATVQAALREHPPLSSKGKLLKIKYVTQATTDPPTFVFFVNDPELVHFSYERFLENRLRAAFGFEGTAVRLVFRGTRATAKQSEGAAPRRLRA